MSGSPIVSKSSSHLQRRWKSQCRQTALSSYTGRFVVGATGMLMAVNASCPEHFESSPVSPSNAAVRRSAQCLSSVSPPRGA